MSKDSKVMGQILFFMHFFKNFHLLNISEASDKCEKTVPNYEDLNLLLYKHQGKWACKC